MEVSRFKFKHEAIPSVEFERVNYSDAEILQWCVFIVYGEKSQLTNMHLSEKQLSNCDGFLDSLLFFTHAMEFLRLPVTNWDVTGVV